MTANDLSPPCPPPALSLSLSQTSVHFFCIVRSRPPPSCICEPCILNMKARLKRIGLFSLSHSRARGHYGGLQSSKPFVILAQGLIQKNAFIIRAVGWSGLCTHRCVVLRVPACTSGGPLWLSLRSQPCPVQAPSAVDLRRSWERPWGDETGSGSLRIAPKGHAKAVLFNDVNQRAAC